MKTNLLFFLSLILISCRPEINPLNDSTNPFYITDNTDDRNDFFELKHPDSDTWKKQARGVGMILIKDYQFKPEANGDLMISTVKPNIVSYGDLYKLCADELFRYQPAIGDCTCFLVDDRHVFTAGHCLERYTPENYAIIFDYVKSNPDSSDYLIPKENIYSIKEIKYNVYSTERDKDFAIVELDRPVSDPSRALYMNKNGGLAQGDSLYMIGHPIGLPMKFAGNGVALDINTSADGNPLKFEASLDAFSGNSGSPVFNALTHEVEGVLTSGEADFIVVQKNGECCKTPYLLPGDCWGVGVIKIEYVLEAFDKIKKVELQ